MSVRLVNSLAASEAQALAAHIHYVQSQIGITLNISRSCSCMQLSRVRSSFGEQWARVGCVPKLGRYVVMCNGFDQLSNRKVSMKPCQTENASRQASCSQPFEIQHVPHVRQKRSFRLVNREQPAADWLQSIWQHGFCSYDATHARRGSLNDACA